ncbi:hypothetical protein cyc_09313 [Cyclospora cayetanensis]|uniref:Uncharacterized protein n=1 Tax=Cyclospora cayetanensis TaxID=88456 RepID=A0A1D3CU78_9EIME|nr:hypothetical protein cyc_09313 [Cyclospora cayetanensis]
MPPLHRLRDDGPGEIAPGAENQNTGQDISLLAWIASGKNCPSHKHYVRSKPSVIAFTSQERTALFIRNTCVRAGSETRSEVPHYGDMLQIAISIDIAGGSEAGIVPEAKTACFRLNAEDRS